MEKEEMISFRLNSELKQGLTEIATAEDMPVSQYLRKMIKNKVEQYAKTKLEAESRKGRR